MERNFPKSAPPDGGKLQKVKAWLEEADAVLIGAGAGLSTAAGFTYSGERFERYFSDFEAKYGFHDMYSGGFYPYASLEEFWAYWSRYIYVNRYDQPAGKPYEDLLSLVKEKDCFVLTTNVDHRFQAAGYLPQQRCAIRLHQSGTCLRAQGDRGSLRLPCGGHRQRARTALEK